jgi:glycosyltransferase involved in cell wall biosynthesis
MTAVLLPEGAQLVCDPPRAGSPDRPWVSMLLISYNQQGYIGAAVAGALAQTYSPLEVIVSDDASDDGTYAAMQRALSDYAGPHRVILNRNPTNLGIGAHLSRLVGLSRGELLFVAAGDDISLPQRCARVVDAWLACGRRVDLIASALVDLDEHGGTHQVIVPTDLARYRDLRDWIADPPHVIGAAQAWTRRVFDRYGPLPAGVAGEDLIMVARAIGSGGALTLAEPLVHYRRGGLSRRVRTNTADDVVKRLLNNNRHALVELPLLLADAQKTGQLEAVRRPLEDRLARERYIGAIFTATGAGEKLRLAARCRSVPFAVRLRMLVYAGWPWLLAPWFAVKRWRARSGKHAH